MTDDNTLLHVDGVKVYFPYTAEIRFFRAKRRSISRPLTA